MDVKGAFLYGKIEKEVYVCQPPRFEDPEFPDRVYKLEKALHGLHQAPRAWYETLSTYLLDKGFQRGKIDKTLFIKRVKGDILVVQYAKDPPFDLEAYTDSDYASASLDRKSTTGVLKCLTPKVLIKGRLIVLICGEFYTNKCLKWNGIAANDGIKVSVVGLTYYWLPLELQLLRALKFVDSHNMVAYLQKSTENADFDEIVDFLNANPIRYALTSNDPPLSRFHTLGSGEDRMKLNELMEICTKLSDRVLALENVKTAQDLEITSLKKREDASKQGRNEDQDEDISWFQDDAKTQERYAHDINVTTASAPITTVGVSVSTDEPGTPLTITTTLTEDEDLIIA
ncbi:retrovirus-related pol polyprotein from transposon TNT 1-94 [Tanacetum coccineum]